MAGPGHEVPQEGLGSVRQPTERDIAVWDKSVAESPDLPAAVVEGLADIAAGRTFPAPWKAPLAEPGFAGSMQRGLDQLHTEMPDAVSLFSSRAGVEQRMKDHPEEFGSAYVAKPGTEGLRLLQEEAIAEGEHGATLNLEEEPGAAPTQAPQLVPEASSGITRSQPTHRGYTITIGGDTEFTTDNEKLAIKLGQEARDRAANLAHLNSSHGRLGQVSKWLQSFIDKHF
jgi:hypothetical protein